jgi:hypothetical protein
MQKVPLLHFLFIFAHKLQKTMKRLISIIIAILAAAAAAYAQEPQDSTVYVIARWQVGDKYAYEYSSKECKTANGDTTEFAYSNAILIYEILEETETSYKASVTYKDEFSSDQLNNMLNDLLAERYGDPKIIFTTDQYGTLQSIDNVQELSDQILSIIDEMVELLIKNDTEGALDESQSDFLKDYLKQMFGNHDTVMKIFAEDIARVLYFHGCALKLDEEYTGQIQVPSIYPGIDQPLPAELTIWADSEYTDEYSIVCRSYTTLSNEGFKEVVVNSIINNIKTEGAEAGLSDEDIQAAILEVEKSAQNAECIMDEYSTAEIHAATGWPLNIWYDKDVVINVEDQNQTQNTSWTLKIIIPSKEE